MPTSGKITLLTRTAVLLVLFFMFENASGSCLSYGHSCWGAHGKRSGSETGLNQRTRWFLSKLAEASSSSDPLEERTWRTQPAVPAILGDLNSWRNDDLSNQDDLLKSLQDLDVMEVDYAQRGPEIARDGLDDVLMISDNPFPLKKHVRRDSGRIFKQRDHDAEKLA